MVHVHALFSFPPIAAAVYSYHQHVPYLVRPLGVLQRWGMQHRHPWLKHLSFRLIERRILTHAAAVHYTSEVERQEALTFDVAQNAVVIPNAVTARPDICGQCTSRFRARYPQLAGRRIILFLSRLDLKKGLDLLLPAFAEMRAHHPDASLVLAGDGDPVVIARTQRDARRLGIASDILWTGFLGDEEKWEALVDADVFVLPSYAENFGMAVVEAMAVGVAVVISDRVSLAREVQHAEAGLATTLDVPSIAAALKQLLAEPLLRKEMGRNGQRMVRERFATERITQQLIAVYEGVLGEVRKER
jgi:glycosyltransferase involved in cell wall biosynthesis